MKLLNIYNMGGKKRARIAGEAKDAANKSLTDARAQRELAQTRVDEQRAAYEDFQFTNPYEDISMENVYEDLTVNQQQAQFQAQQGRQQRSDIMQGLRGAAGGSGIAALAQSMANQGQLQTQQISASIGQQESQIQQLQAQGATDVLRREQLKAQGAASVQQAESGRISTLLGMEYGALAGAEQGVQQGFANQQSALGMEAEMQAANQQMWGDIIGGTLGMVGSLGTAAIGAKGAKDAAKILKG